MKIFTIKSHLIFITRLEKAGMDFKEGEVDQLSALILTHALSMYVCITITY